MWDLPAPGLEHMSPALARGFLTTAPPGKSLFDCLDSFRLWVPPLDFFTFPSSMSPMMHPFHHNPHITRAPICLCSHCTYHTNPTQINPALSTSRKHIHHSPWALAPLLCPALLAYDQFRGENGHNQSGYSSTFFVPNRHGSRLFSSHLPSILCPLLFFSNMITLFP